MPSRRHELFAKVIPKVRRSGDVIDADQERMRIERWHDRLDRALPTRLVPGFARRFSVVTQQIGDPATPGGATFPSYVITPRGVRPTRTIYYLHGGGYTAPIDGVHVRHACRLARALGARVVMPDYPLAPEHTWRDSHAAIVADAARWTGEPGGVVLAGDSAGGGYALTVAQFLRDAGTPATHLLLHAPWVDLSTSTPETTDFDRIDPWLFLSKLHLFAEWWAGGDDLARPELSPGLADLRGLPPALMFYGTRDLLAPGCRLLVRRAREADWDLTAAEEADLIHVFSILPTLPEARRAWKQTLAWLR